MKIGVITHFRTDDNYGGVLQTYALQKFLIKLGHSPFLINYVSQQKNKNFSFKTILKDLLRPLVHLISASKREEYHKTLEYIQLRKANRTLNKQRKFASFLKENLSFSPITYYTYDSLKKNPPEADVYITGSDQVWNPSLFASSTGVWYLDFGSPSTKRISYAASIGREISQDEESRFKAFVNKFDAVSVREKSAQEFCLNLGLSQTKLVLDPTLLVSFDVFLPLIQSFLNKKKKSPYVFLYYLNVEDASEIEWNQITDFVADNKLDLISVASSGYLPAKNILPEGYKLSYLTIPEWIGNLYSADYVVTTSFHGVAFAILTHRPFVAILLRNKYSKGNVRITSLLSDLKLEAHILTNDRAISDILKTPIDWAIVDQILEDKRRYSRDFLVRNI